MRKLDVLGWGGGNLDTAFLAYLNIYKSSTESTVTCLLQKHNPAYAFNLVMCEFDPKLAKLAFGPSGA